MGCGGSKGAVVKPVTDSKHLDPPPITKPDPKPATPRPSTPPSVPPKPVDVQRFWSQFPFPPSPDLVTTRTALNCSTLSFQFETRTSQAPLLVWPPIVSNAKSGKGTAAIAAPAQPARLILERYGAEGAGEDQFERPLGLSFDSEGKWLVVCDCGNDRVKMLDPFSGQCLTSFGEYGTGDGQFRSPVGTAFSADGRFLYVADRDNNVVKIFSTTAADVVGVASEAVVQVRDKATVRGGGGVGTSGAVGENGAKQWGKLKGAAAFVGKATAEKDSAEDAFWGALPMRTSTPTVRYQSQLNFDGNLVVENFTTGEHLSDTCSLKLPGINLQ